MKPSLMSSCNTKVNQTKSQVTDSAESTSENPLKPTSKSTKLSPLLPTSECTVTWTKKITVEFEILIIWSDLLQISFKSNFFAT